MANFAEVNDNNIYLFSKDKVPLSLLKGDLFPLQTHLDIYFQKA